MPKEFAGRVAHLRHVSHHNTCTRDSKKFLETISNINTAANSSWVALPKTSAKIKVAGSNHVFCKTAVHKAELLSGV